MIPDMDCMIYIHVHACDKPPAILLFVVLQVLDLDRSGLTKLRKSIKAMLNSGNGLLKYFTSVHVFELSLTFTQYCDCEKPFHDRFCCIKQGQIMVQIDLYISKISTTFMSPKRSCSSVTVECLLWTNTNFGQIDESWKQ